MRPNLDKIIILLLHFFLVTIGSQAVFSQNPKVFIDETLGNNFEILGVAEPLDLWLSFLHAQSSKEGARYWNSKEVLMYSDSSYFKLMDLYYFGNKNEIVRILQRGTTILSITEADGIYKITSKYELRSNDTTSSTFFLFHVYAKRENERGPLKLYNPFPVNAEIKMNSHLVDGIRYVYPQDYKYSRRTGRKLTRLIKDLANEYNLPFTGGYTFCYLHNRDMYFKMRGYDFHFENLGKEKPMGTANISTKTAYVCGKGGFYPHELIHLLINPIWTSAHTWFIEGFATYYGQSRAQPLGWHTQRLKAYLNDHPEIDFSNMLDYVSMDDYTDYRYVLGGLLVGKAYKEGGAEKVKALMSYGKTQDDFYLALKEVLGVERNNLNSYIRKALDEAW